MRKENQEIEKYRIPGVSKKEDGNNGIFLIPFQTTTLKVIASDGEGWDHVSVSLKNRCPNWPEMCHVKDVFFSEDETVVQFHPRKSDYVNNHPYCLHLWKKQSENYLLPPTEMV